MSGMRRVLAHRVVHAGRVYRLAIADISGPEIVVEPFSVVQLQPHKLSWPFDESVQRAE